MYNKNLWGLSFGDSKIWHLGGFKDMMSFVDPCALYPYQGLGFSFELFILRSFYSLQFWAF
jgi:hypothetical protein